MSDRLSKQQLFNGAFAPLLEDPHVRADGVYTLLAEDLQLALSESLDGDAEDEQILAVYAADKVKILSGSAADRIDDALYHLETFKAKVQRDDNTKCIKKNTKQLEEHGAQLADHEVRSSASAIAVPSIGERSRRGRPPRHRPPSTRH